MENKNLNFTINYVYCEKAEEQNKDFLILQGGSRSGKTYNIVLWLIIKALKEKNIIHIFRKERASILKSVYIDFENILTSLNLFYKSWWNKTELSYTFPNGSKIEFLGLDDPQKVRGVKRDYSFINEANNTTFEDFNQVNLRTAKRIILDYNPSEKFWVHSRLMEEDEFKDTYLFYVSTYKDNPFLEERSIRAIERLKNIDYYLWQVYGLGEIGKSTEIIFKQWNTYEEYNGDSDIYLGFDFGFNDPNACILIRKDEKKLFIEELLYKREMSIEEIKMFFLDLESKNIITKDTQIIADNSRPEIIQEIFNLGFNIHSCVKGKNSIVEGITLLIQYEIYLKSDSINLKKEFESYKWKLDKNSQKREEPVDYNNHLIDALRYGIQAFKNETPLFFSNTY